MHTTTTPTPPAMGGVFHSPPLARARKEKSIPLVGTDSGQTGYIKISLRSQTTGAPAHAHEGIGDRAAYFKAWRTAKFGGDFDPVSAAVDEAATAFPGDRPDQDRRVWLKIANRAGADAFMDAVWQKAAEIREDEARGRSLRNKAAAFQKLLNRRFPKGGAQ